MVSKIKTNQRNGLWAFLLLIALAGCGFDRTASLEGNVRLQGREDFEGIQVYIPGTDHRAVTDAEGNYRIRNIPPGDYTLVASMEGFDEQRRAFMLQPGEEHTLETLVLPETYVPAGSISGYAITEEGITHEDIIVMLVGTSHSTTTNTTGFFQLADVSPGEYLLYAFKEGWLPKSREGVIVQDGQETEVEELFLEQQGSVESATSDDAGEGQRIVQGFAYLESRDDHAGIRVSISEQASIATMTSATGYFRLQGLGERPYTLMLEKEGFIPEQIEGVEPALPENARNVGYVTLQEEYVPEMVGILQGNVYLENADDHANTIVRLVGVSQSVITDQQGRYLLTGVPAGEQTLVAEHPGYETGRLEGVQIAPESISQAPDLTLSATASLEENATGTIEGTALLEGANDHGGITVAIEGTSQSAVTDIQGNFRIESIPIGAYSLVYSKGGYRNLYMSGIVVDPGRITTLDRVILRQDVEPPRVIETFPRDGARRVGFDQWVDVLVKFSDRMLGDTVKPAVVIEPPVAYDAFFDRESDFSNVDTLHLRLYREGPNPVVFNTRYAVTILPQAQNTKGAVMAEPYTFQFMTDGPLVTRTVPQDGDQRYLWTPDQPIIIETNAPVDPNTLQRAMRFRPEADSMPLFDIQPRGAGAVIFVNTTLRMDRQYRMTLGNALRTINGQRFSNTPYSVRFRTMGINSPRRANRR